MENIRTKVNDVRNNIKLLKGFYQDASRLIR